MSIAIADGESVTDIQNIITDFFGEGAAARARTIAQTESTVAAGFAANDAIDQAGISQKEWITTRDGKARSTHMAIDGQVVATQGEFRSPSGDKAQYPGGFSTAAENINCRCAVIAVVQDEEKQLTEQDKDKLWFKREVKRQSIEDQFNDAIKEIFKIQSDAVIARFNAIIS